VSQPGNRAKKPADTAKDGAPKRVRKPAKASAAVQPAEAPAEPVIILPADLRIGAAAALHGDILAASGGTDLLINGEAVVKVDAAALQALLAGLIQISRSGASWRWHNPSTTLLQGVTVLGLGKSLRLP
jgi:phospholipid transport system transporter-binding protein